MKYENSNVHKIKFLNTISDAIALPNFHVQISATRLYDLF